tara:strand:- start:1229 stop:1612 length:384 start_codon:yes stop_codon:yes gene_type:complete
MSKKKIASNRSFGIVFFILFLIIGIYPILNDQNIRIWSIIVSLIFLILGSINSRILTPLNIIWLKFGLVLGKLVSPFIMATIFFLVVTPTGIIMRIFGKDLLNLKKNKSKSYWIEKKDLKSDMKNQF